MPNGVCPFATYQPGADSHLNGARGQGVPFAVLHRTQGIDSRGLGRTRHHSTPGTFQFLIHRGELYQFYPARVRCTHAAGGNDGPGVEIEGFTGEPVPAVDLTVLGRLAHWLHDTYGVPLTMYDGARRYIDDTGFRGFVTHRSIETAPEWRHTNYITPAEWLEAIGDDVTDDQARQLAFTFALVGDIYNVKPGSPIEKRFAALEAKVDAVATQVGAPQTSVTDLLKRMFPKRAARG